MFTVYVNGRHHKFSTLRDAVVYFEQIADDAVVLSASNFVFRIRRDGKVFSEGCQVYFNGRVYRVVNIKDLQDTCEIYPYYDLGSMGQKVNLKELALAA